MCRLRCGWIVVSSGVCVPLVHVGVAESEDVVTSTRLFAIWYNIKSLASARLLARQVFMQDKIIASHTCFGGHMDVKLLNVSDGLKWTTNTHVTPFSLTFKA